MGKALTASQPPIPRSRQRHERWKVKTISGLYSLWVQAPSLQPVRTRAEGSTRSMACSSAYGVDIVAEVPAIDSLIVADCVPGPLPPDAARWYHRTCTVQKDGLRDLRGSPGAIES